VEGSGCSLIDVLRGHVRGMIEEMYERPWLC
jgi:hypothetical protein